MMSAQWNQILRTGVDTAVIPLTEILKCQINTPHKRCLSTAPVLRPILSQCWRNCRSQPSRNQAGPVWAPALWSAASSSWSPSLPLCSIRRAMCPRLRSTALRTVLSKAMVPQRPKQRQPLIQPSSLRHPQIRKVQPISQETAKGGHASVPAHFYVGGVPC